MNHNKVKMGKHVYIGYNVKFMGPVEIKNRVIIEDNVTIGHPNDEEMRKFKDALYSTDDKISMGDFVNNKTVIGAGSIIRSGTIIYSGTVIGENLDCYHNVDIGSETKIGKNVKISSNSQILNHVKIGDNCRIKGYCANYCEIGNNVSMFGSLVHKYKEGYKPNLIEKSPKIGDDAIIGERAVVIGVTIGKGAYVGGGAVVIEDVPPNDKVVGVPAKSKKPLELLQKYLEEDI